MIDPSKEYIVVSATALATSGALTILKQFIEHAASDKNEYIVFVNVDLKLPIYDNIIYVESKPKGWFERIIWDWHGCEKFIKTNRLKVKKVVSLQNTTLNTARHQIVYLHQPIPFSSYTSSLTELTISNLKLYLYKKLYSYFIFKFSNKNTIFVVQTNWMKDGVLNKCSRIKENQIFVIKPDIKVFMPSQKTEKANKGIFLYPATPLSYKNHVVLLKAFTLLKSKKQSNCFKLQVTFSKGSYRKFDDLVSKYSLDDNIEYLGYIDFQRLYIKYQEASAILYPSYIESYGLPLIEAASLGKQIICSNLPYAKDVLEGYDGAIFVNYNEVEEWAIKISEMLDTQNIVSFNNFENDQRSSWPQFFELLK